jgi:hypothetical protein
MNERRTNTLCIRPCLLTTEQHWHEQMLLLVAAVVLLPGVVAAGLRQEVVVEVPHPGAEEPAVHNPITE